MANEKKSPCNRAREINSHKKILMASLQEQMQIWAQLRDIVKQTNADAETLEAIRAKLNTKPSMSP